MALIDGLISYWKLDESSGDALDAHASNDLTDNNTVGTGTGKINNGRDYERTNNESHSIADASQSGLDFGNEDFSVSCWIFGESFISFTFHSIINKGSPESLTNFAYALYINDATLSWRVSNADFSQQTVSDGSLSTSTWYHIVAWHDATANEIGLVVNDGTPATAAWSNGCHDVTSSFRLGGYSSGSAFDGIIDEVGIWGKVLSSAEITELYNSGSGLAYPFSGGGGGPSLIFPSHIIRPKLFVPKIFRPSILSRFK